MSLQPSGCIIDLLKALGYTDLDEEMMAFTGNYFDVLFMGSRLIDDASMDIKMLSMTPEERAKQELIIKNRKELAEKKKKEAEYKKHMADLSNKDRKAKAQEPVKDSVGNKLNFGANVVKFEPPPESRGGWGWARFKDYD